MDEINEMNDWKSKNETKKLEDSVGESSASNPPINVKKKTPAVENSSGSYASDDFEDVSASGSAAKGKMNYWPGKDSYNNK